MSFFKEHTGNFFKGFAMGTANVIPGVSGGTIALITGIFERLIDSLKSFDIKAIKLFFTGKFKEFAKHTDFVFLFVVLLGTGVSIISVAKLLSFLFDNYPIFIWSYFFGLILASVWFVGKTVEKWNFTVILFFILGTSIAIIITVLNPAKENDSFMYLVLSGIVAICSMILPGISGSFILVLMGEYELVLKAINEFNFSVIIPIGIGCVVGLLAFSHLLSWLYKKFKNQTISLLVGFILGSLAIIWPWKNSFDSNHSLINTNEFGKLLVETETKVFSYKRVLPEMNWIFFVAIVIAILGYLTILLLEKSAKKKQTETTKTEISEK
jgi:putative membrane protein